jgi:CubicO group peptidase (beta-lactamase class C family)
MLNPYADYTVDQLYEFLGGYTLPREPGAQFEYSNLGVGLLGHVLALRAGVSFEALVLEHIIEPLGMHFRGRRTARQRRRSRGDPAGHAAACAGRCAGPEYRARLDPARDPAGSGTAADAIAAALARSTRQQRSRQWTLSLQRQDVSEREPDARIE